MKISLDKILWRYILALLPLIAFQACSSDSGILPEPEPEPSPTPVPEDVNRTILVYMAAANSLGNGQYDMADIAEMQYAAQEGKIKGNRLIVFHEDKSGSQILKEVDSNTGELVQLSEFDNSLSALSSKRMTEVINETKRLAPADDYGLILWSHANGWLVTSNTPDTDQGNPYAVKPLAFGEEIIGSSRLHMNTSVLANTLMGHDFSFVYFDCCYMACVEVLYDMIGVSPYVVASTAEVIAEGMPYHLSLPYLFAKGQADLKGAVSAVYNYVDSKTDFNRTCTLSVFDMSKVENLAEKARTFYSFQPAASNSFRPQRYMWESTCYFYDLGHIVENLNLTSDTDPEVLEAFETSRSSLLDAIEDLVEYKVNTPYVWPGEYEQIEISHYSGVSSQFLRDAASASRNGYNETAWWNDVARYMFE